MSEQDAGAIGVAQAFANLSARAVEVANANRLRASRQNIRAETQQVQLAETEQRRQIARDLARFQGTLRTNQAFRGAAGTSASGIAAQRSALQQAGEAAANVTANAAFRESAIIRANRVDLEDPGLAALEGAIRGFGVGQQIQAGLRANARTERRRGREVRVTPGLDLQRLFSGDIDIFDPEQLRSVFLEG